MKNKDVVLNVSESNISFHYRVRGILKQDDKFLIMCVDDAGYYHLPGGHVEVGESSEQAIKREIKEEIGIEVNINKLICVNEQFFAKGNINCHELVFYFMVNAKDKTKVEDVTRIENDKGKICKNEIRWVTAEELKYIDLKPRIIKDLVLGDQLYSLCHIVNGERNVP